MGRTSTYEWGQREDAIHPITDIHPLSPTPNGLRAVYRWPEKALRQREDGQQCVWEGGCQGNVGRSIRPSIVGSIRPLLSVHPVRTTQTAPTKVASGQYPSQHPSKVTVPAQLQLAPSRSALQDRGIRL